MVPDLDAAFLAGIKEELASIEDNEKNIQALSQVFRYYAKHAKQLAQVLFSFLTQQCFPWELIHALNLLDDILLLDSTGRYRAELAERVHTVAVSAFRKVPSEQEKREVAKMLLTWQELKIFDAATLEAIREKIRRGSDAAARILLEAALAMEEDEESVPEPGPGPEAAKAEAEAAPPRAPAAAPGPEAAPAPPQAKRPRLPQPPPSSQPAALAEARPAAAARGSEKVMAVVSRILQLPAARPFDILGIAREGSNGHDVRKAYRRIALLIHPDKNPGLEAQCQEALIKLQQGRETAEAEMQQSDVASDKAGRGSETRCDATTARANDGVDSSFKCRYPGCDLPPCKQCANGCCTRNITHCHMIARGKDGQQCFFHPPPRAWARNAE